MNGKSVGEVCGKMLRGKLSPLSGKQEWVVVGDDYDYIQEIARSTYADMLHDYERNEKYKLAIEKVLKEEKERGRETHVLDIGTGTGYLAMLSASAGASRVSACEAFGPIYETAKKVRDLNGFDCIHMVGKRSTDLDLKDIGQKADVVVAEVFDTELIGEGALRTFKDAHKRLLKESPRVVPAKGKIWVLPFQSDTISGWEKPKRIQIPQFDVDVIPPPNYVNCGGSGSVHDVQLDQIGSQHFTALSDPFPCFEFDFEDPTKLPYDESKLLRIPLKDHNHCKADGLFFWWDLDMAGDGEIILSDRKSVV